MLRSRYMQNAILLLILNIYGKTVTSLDSQHHKDQFGMQKSCLTMAKKVRYMLLPARLVKNLAARGIGYNQKLSDSAFDYGHLMQKKHTVHYVHLIDFQPINTKYQLKLRSHPWPSARPFATIVRSGESDSTWACFVNVESSVRRHTTEIRPWQSRWVNSKWIISNVKVT